LAHTSPWRGEDLRSVLMRARLERAIGVIYRPETELASHYFDAHLPKQFDAYIWFEETRAIRPLPAEPKEAFRKPIHSDCECAISRRRSGALCSSGPSFNPPFARHGPVEPAEARLAPSEYCERSTCSTSKFESSDPGRSDSNFDVQGVGRYCRYSRRRSGCCRRRTTRRKSLVVRSQRRRCRPARWLFVEHGLSPGNQRRRIVDGRDGCEPIQGRGDFWLPSVGGSIMRFVYKPRE
jgi:hypothetical protein